MLCQRGMADGLRIDLQPVHGMAQLLDARMIVLIGRGPGHFKRRDIVSRADSADRVEQAQTVAAALMQTFDIDVQRIAQTFEFVASNPLEWDQPAPARKKR